MAGMKRPSPEPADATLSKAQKKPKVQKKKKKRDPNEPQKLVLTNLLFSFFLPPTINFTINFSHQFIIILI